MIILSKFKDYYDYLMGIYGRDETLVFDRRHQFMEKPSGPSFQEFHIAICGERYLVLMYKEIFYHTLEEIQVLQAILKREEDHEEVYPSAYTKKNKKKDAEKFWKENNGVKTDVNYKHRSPILLKYRFDESAWSPVLLKDYGFPSWYPADEMYQKVYAFISYLKDHPEIPNKQTNKEKIVSHGFDLKKSFRHRKV